jgi:aldehyde:ferredoxin oxidoreductase
MEKTHGWMGVLLRVELPSAEVSKTKTLDYAEDFVGGRAMASKIYWDEVSRATGSLDGDSILMLMPGPLGGTPATAGSRLSVTAKSPLAYPEQYGCGNGGGFSGAALKRAGYDGLIIRGKAKGPSYILIENEKVELRDASKLWGLTCEHAMEELKECHGAGAGIVCIGPAGENLVRFAVAMTDQGGTLSNGVGAIMGSKNLKAIVVRGSTRVPVAHPKKLSEINERARSLRKGLNESTYMTEPTILIEGIEKAKDMPCYACPAGCMRANFRHSSGLTEVRKTCQAVYFYSSWDQLYHGKITDTPFLATSLCDRFGLCTMEINNMIRWLYDCFKKGIVSEEETNLPLGKIGSLEFIEVLVDMITRKRGFGEILSQGTRRAAIEKGKAAEEEAFATISPSGYAHYWYEPRIFLSTALFYATEPRTPVIQLHEFAFLLLKWTLWHTTGGVLSPIDTENLRKIAKRAWGSEKAVDFSTYDGKAEAAVIIQNRQHAKETMVVCDRYYPILETDQQEDHMGDPTLVPGLFHAVTGRDMSEGDYLLLGERSVNLQRAIQGREGRVGRKEDTIGEFNFSKPLETAKEDAFSVQNPDYELPGAGDEIVVRKGQTLDPAEFERMKDEYYQLRGWDIKTGLQKKEKLEELGLSVLCNDMERLRLLKQISGRRKEHAEPSRNLRKL